MLDSFLKVACGHAQKREDQAHLVEKMRQMPEELLLKIASGEEKLGFYGPESGCWLDKFRGTPFIQQAIELEKQELQLQMADKAQWREEDQKRTAGNAARDELCVQKKLLELQLVEEESGGGGEAAGAEALAGEGIPEEEALAQGQASPALAAAVEPKQPKVEPKKEPAQESPSEQQAMKMAYAKMKLAYGRAALEPHLTTIESDAANRKFSPETEAAFAAIRGRLSDDHRFLQDKAEYARQHPVLNKLKGAVVPGVLGGIGGAMIGVGGASNPLKGAAIGGAAGALGLGGLGALIQPGARSFQEGADTNASAINKVDYASHLMRGTAKQQQLEGKTAGVKVAVGIGTVGTSVLGGLKSIGGAAKGAYTAARGFGGSVPEAARMAAGAVKGTAPGALSTMGRAATSYAKANPGKALGLAAGTGLVADRVLLPHSQQQ